jgi:CheY-like chemotaxis protein
MAAAARTVHPADKRGLIIFIEERTLRILLVEDHPFQLIGLEMQLNRLGLYQLTPALDSAEVLILIEEGRRFDLLLCDQHLPDGYGIDLIERAHALGGIRFAMLISGIDDTPLRQQLLQDAQARGIPLLAYLEKPLSAALFQQALEPVWHDI